MSNIANSLVLDKGCLETARKQFCLDIGLPWEEYVAEPTKKAYICKSVYKVDTLDISSEGARKYVFANSFFKAIICLGQLFIACDERIYDWVVEQYEDCPVEWFCAYANLRRLDEKLAEFGQKIYDTHVYFLPEEYKVQGYAKNSVRCEAVVAEKDVVSCGNTIGEEATVRGEGSLPEMGNAEDFVWYSQEEILRFKDSNRFSSAICFSPTQPDVLAVAHMRKEYGQNMKTGLLQEVNNVSGEDTGCLIKDFDQSHMAGMAGVSEDGEYLWQVGINVEEDCAGQGLANRLVRTLKEEILKRGKVPFYGTSESHSVSMTVGLKAGFVPAWTEIFVCEGK